MPMNPRMLRPLARFQAPPPPFSPLDISGLALWLDGNDASTFTLNGTTISEWRDKSGNSRHFSQATALLQPAPATSVKNGRDAVAFTNDWISGEYTYDIGTIFLVWEQPSTASDDPFPGVISARTAAADKVSNGSLGLCINSYAYDTNTIFADPYPSGLYALNGSDSLGAQMLGYGNGGVAIRTSPDRWQYLSIVFDSVVSGSKPILLGADANGFTERLMQNGHVGEFICYEGALSSQDVAAVTDYLVEKWGLE